MKDNLGEWSWDERVPHVLISPTSLFQTKLTNNLEATSICCQAPVLFSLQKTSSSMFISAGTGQSSRDWRCLLFRVSVTSVCFKSKGRTGPRQGSHSGTYSKEMESVLTSVPPNIETSGDVFSNLSGDPARLFSLFLYKTWYVLGVSFRLFYPFTCI